MAKENMKVNTAPAEDEDGEEHAASRSSRPSEDNDTPPWSAQSAPEYRDGTEVF